MANANPGGLEQSVAGIATAKVAIFATMGTISPEITGMIAKLAGVALAGLILSVFLVP